MGVCSPNNGYNVIAEAENGLKALEQYPKVQPDIVTLDITMPELDGLQTVKELRKMDPQVNVIMVSAMGQKSMVVDAIQSGAKDFIVKPFDEGRVKEAFSKLHK